MHPLFGGIGIIPKTLALEPETYSGEENNPEYHPGRLDTLACLSLPRPGSDRYAPGAQGRAFSTRY